MIYPYAVNHNGKIYVAGEDVPIETQEKMDLIVEEKAEEIKPEIKETETKKKSVKKAK